jgi:hypothetical protein
MVLSKGCEVVGLGYSRLSGDAARVVDRGRESDNPNRVGRVRQEYDTDRWTDWVTRGGRGIRDGGSGQQADRVTRVSQHNRDSNPKSGNTSWDNRVGNTEQKTGGSSQVVNTLSRVAQNSANAESGVAQNSANMESRVTENSVNTENRVMQDSGCKKLEEEKGDAPSKRPAPRWCPKGITKTQKCRL